MAKKQPNQTINIPTVVTSVATSVAATLTSLFAAKKLGLRGLGNVLNVPANISNAFAIALKKYPELWNENIVLRLEPLNTTMAASIAPKTILTGARQYEISINNSKTATAGVHYSYLTPTMLVGLFGHELAHILHYQSLTPSQMIKLGVKYFLSDKYTRQLEAETDAVAITRGFGNGLIEYKNFVYNNTTGVVPKRFQQYYKNTYLPALNGIDTKQLTLFSSNKTKTKTMTNGEIILQNAIEAKQKGLLTSWEKNFLSKFETYDKKQLRTLTSAQYKKLRDISDKNTDDTPLTKPTATKKDTGKTIATVKVNGVTVKAELLKHGEKYSIKIAGIAKIIRQYILAKYPVIKKVWISTEVFMGGDKISVYITPLPINQYLKLEKDLESVFQGYITDNTGEYNTKNNPTTIDYKGSSIDITVKYIYVLNYPKEGTKEYADWDKNPTATPKKSPVTRTGTKRAKKTTTPAATQKAVVRKPAKKAPAKRKKAVARKPVAPKQPKLPKTRVDSIELKLIKKFKAMHNQTRTTTTFNTFVSDVQRALSNSGLRHDALMKKIASACKQILSASKTATHLDISISAELLKKCTDAVKGAQPQSIAVQMAGVEKK